MKMETQEVTLRKMTASDGHVFKQAAGDDIYGNVIYLSIADAPENYIEIIEAEAAELLAKLAEQS